MANQSQRPELSAAAAAAMTELEGLARFRHVQREASSETQVAARPLEFDDDGFPLTQPTGRFVHRVRRLLGDG
jgi:hypothetical protein